MAIAMIKRLITIHTLNDEEMCTVRDKICEQLAGNKDYISNDIIVNGGDDRRDGTTDVHVYIYENCANIPSITI